MDEIKQEKLPIDAKLLSEAVIELNISRRSVGLYPPEHPILKSSIEKAFELLRKLFELRNSITLGIAKDALVIDEYTLDKKNPVFREFALSLHGKGIAAVTFDSALEVGELVSLHELITMREGPVGNALLKLAEQKGLRHIQLSPIDLSVFNFMEGKTGAGFSASKLWEDYIYGLLEGKLATGDAEDLIVHIPPEQVAFYVNMQMAEDAPEETYNRVISTYLRRKSQLASGSDVFKSFMSFVENLRPELKARFLNKTLSQPPPETDVERMITELTEEDLKRFLEICKDHLVTIPESLRNLLHKLEGITEKGKLFFDMTTSGKTYLDDIELDENIVKFLEEDQFRTYIGEQYEKELELMLKGIKAERTRLTEVLRQNSGERTVDRTFSEIILELLDSDSVNEEEFQKLITILTDLVNNFLETGRFQEMCEVYNSVDSYALTGKFNNEASDFVESFFRSEEFILRLIEAFKFWGRYEKDSAVEITKGLKLYIITPLLDAISGESNPSIKRFLLQVLSTLGSEVAREATRRLSNENWQVVENMITIIRECEGKEYIRDIKPFAKDKNKKISLEAVRTLLHFGDRDGPHYLKMFLMSDDHELREQGAVLAGAYKVKNAIPFLIEVLEKKDIYGSESYDKIPAIRALAKIGDPGAIEPLKKLFKSKSLFFSSARNELKLEIFKNLRHYPAHAIKPLLELGLASSDKEIKAISERLLKESQTPGDKKNE
jgi:HEAT repeat protein